ncbi:MAG: heparinase II/III family protein [Mediterranea sp.]|jgi:heparan-sulfate lyase|nr:heparinase II/III family protein [Mediterranea sp.]
MKHIPFIFSGLCALLVLTYSCGDADDEWTGGDGDIDVTLLPADKPNDVIDPKLFEYVNLDYPGLETVKSFHEANDHYHAAYALLAYYRMRTSVTNPALSLVNVTLTDDDRAKADYALTNARFFVNNFYEDAATRQPYSLLKGGAINWEFAPEGASDEYQKQLHRHQWFIPQAKAYRVTRDEKYASSWMSVYQDWMTHNPAPASGPNTTSWWQLQVSSRLIDQVQLLEYFKNSANFTPEWLATFLVAFAEQADFLAKYPYAEGGNILVTQGNALATAGTLLPEFKNASTWMDAGYRILGDEARGQFLDDGWHKEMSLHYHIGAIADFYEAMRLAEANGLAGKLPADFTASLRKATEVVTHFTYPNYFAKGSDYVVPAFNDSWVSNWTRNVLKNNFTRYTNMFPDSEELLYMATAANGGTPRGSAPGNGMKLFEQAGYYVLRDGWTPASTVMIFSNNRSNDISKSLSSWSHNQADNGTFELYHAGRNFFPDSGVCTYYASGDGADNTLRYWFRGIDKHNTLSLGKANISKADGKLLKAEEGSTELLVFENQGYTNLKHRRAVFYVDKRFFVLVDEAIGDAEGTLNLSFNLCEGDDTQVVMDVADAGAHTAFADNNNIIVRTFANKTITCSPFTGRRAYAVDGTYATRQAYTIDMEKKADETGRYITVICPATGGANLPVLSASFADSGYSAGGAAVTVTVDGTAYNLSYSL